MSLLLLRLRDCATSSRLGLVDKWPGPEMSELAHLGYVRRVGDGHQVTARGLERLREAEQSGELVKI